MRHEHLFLIFHFPLISLSFFSPFPSFLGKRGKGKKRKVKYDEKMCVPLFPLLSSSIFFLTLLLFLFPLFPPLFKGKGVKVGKGGIKWENFPFFSLFCSSLFFPFFPSSTPFPLFLFSFTHW